ncbi:MULTISPECIES: LacI family DNA-binding transcriptional regulator [unclassified Massilia]|uniref:LacI family DNA-binding transcriptional regulator n=1 Tax=unclassified Massilia TaxID=2609279 RepID=UPI00177D7AAF|nr:MULTISPECIES: LacI family DNA-binding transcriptional regulator [unclassified Massilia]MBD8529350.1 LacI family DNA-binding transcriptional regulator [Massilia sp. CFBP 13647]MBD8672743.1 LacI family DNA-binding transcriptional regulator [Massilia sp. CFBP 13721]
MATIHDVAEQAGVSIKTVSRVLNDAGSVSEKTRQRIEHAMQLLDFAPSAAAQMLRGRPTDLVAVIAEKLTTTPDSSEIIKGIQSVCESLGKMLIIGETGGQASVANRLVADMRTRRVEAIIFATSFHREVTLNEMLGRTPAVLANCFEAAPRFAQVVPDDEGGGYAAAQAVLQAGHRRIAFLQLIEDMVATRLRLRGFRRAMQEHGVQPDEAWLLHGATPADDEFAQLKATIERLFASADCPSAILCGNDKMAMRVIFILQRRGLRVPEDVSVVGFDDFRLISEALDPGLTTVGLPYREIGELAARQALGGAQQPGVLRVPCRAIMRGTVMGPAAAARGAR